MLVFITLVCFVTVASKDTQCPRSIWIHSALAKMAGRAAG